MIYIPQVNFHFIESIIGPRRREYVIKDILTINDLAGMQKFMKQTNEKCLEEVKRVMDWLQITKYLVPELTGTQFYRFCWDSEQFSFRQGYKENLCAIYLNRLHRPELFKELSDATPVPRMKFTQEQTQMLMEFYKKNQYPEKIEREELAQNLTSMTPDVQIYEHNVLVWFQNRRRKEKTTRKSAASRPSSTGSSSPAASSSSSTSTTPFIYPTIDE